MRLVVLILLVGIAPACGAVVASPGVESQPPVTVTIPALSPEASSAADAAVPTIARDSVSREAQRITLRVRNTACNGIFLGSGFALGPRLIVTNRHVFAGASKLEVSTWDGHSLNVTTAAVGTFGDLGVAQVNGQLPQVAHFGPRAKRGQRITVAGYPLGGPLKLTHGVVIDRIPGARFDIGGEVLRITARVQHGNSGGPVLDSHGRVVAIVFAIETATGYGLAIPNDTVRRLVKEGGLQDVPACGQS